MTSGAAGKEGLFQRSVSHWIGCVLSSQDWLLMVSVLLKDAQAASRTCIVFEAKWDPTAESHVTLNDVSAASFGSDGSLAYSKPLQMPVFFLTKAEEMTDDEFVGVLILVIFSQDPNTRKMYNVVPLKVERQHWVEWERERVEPFLNEKGEPTPQWKARTREHVNLTCGKDLLD